MKKIFVGVAMMFCVIPALAQFERTSEGADSYARTRIEQIRDSLGQGFFGGTASALVTTNGYNGTDFRAADSLIGASFTATGVGKADSIYARTFTMASGGMLRWGTTSNEVLIKMVGGALLVRSADDGGYASVTAAQLYGATGVYGVGYVRVGGGYDAEMRNNVGMVVASNRQYVFGSTTDASGAYDAGIVRLGSASLKVTDGGSNAGALTTLSYTSGAPNGGTAGAWKLGSAVTTTGLTASTTVYVEVDVGGTLYKLLTAQ